MKCRLCASPELKLKYKINIYNMYECAKCAYLQIENLPAEEELQTIYGQTYFANTKYRDAQTLSQEYKRRLLLMEYFLKEKAKILDYGCGEGSFASFIKNRFTMYGTDISKYAIQTAKSNYLNDEDKFKLFSSQYFGHTADFFDGIVMWDVIEHIWEPLQACANLLTLLKTGGFLFLSTPNPDSLFARICGKYWPFMTPPEHTGFFAKKSLQYLFEEKLGCKIVRRTSKGKWVNLAFLFYKLKRIFPARISSLTLRLFESKYTKYWSFYIPTYDIQYMVIQKLSAEKGNK